MNTHTKHIHTITNTHTHIYVYFIIKIYLSHLKYSTHVCAKATIETCWVVITNKNMFHVFLNVYGNHSLGTIYHQTFIGTRCKVIAWYHTLHWYMNPHEYTNRTLCEGNWLCKIRMLWCWWLRELAVHCIKRGKVILDETTKRPYYFENLYWIVSNINLFLHVLCSLVFHALCSYSIFIIVHYFLYTGNIISCYFGYANPYFLRPYLPCMIYWSRG